MSDNIDEISITFLKEACKIAQGMVDKNIEVMTIADALSLEKKANNYPPEILINIVDLLKEKNLVTIGSNINQIRVTWDGINHAINLPGEIPTNYGVLSKYEIEERSELITNYLNEQKKEGNIEISIEELRKQFNYGIGAINQFLEHLRKKGVVTILEDYEPKKIRF